MTWVSWRLARPSVIGSAVFVTVLAAYLAVTGLRLREVIDSSGLLECLGHGGSRRTCSDQALTFYRTLNSLTGGQPVVTYVGLLSGVIGVFVGVPLIAREHETGPHPGAAGVEPPEVRAAPALLGPPPRGGLQEAAAELEERVDGLVGADLTDRQRAGHGR